MKFILLSLLLFIITLPIFSAEISHVKQLFNTPIFDKMKLKYKQCVLVQGAQFAKVSTPQEAIKFAPIACKRELLAIKKFFLNSAFKQSVIQGLITSIKEGVEIDLVKTVYNERLKFLKN
ncbi:MAG: hypothetical protein JKY81_01095 [Colwellia sp.]|nr:hypothetical protein [Colwellia sp.]